MLSKILGKILNEGIRVIHEQGRYYEGCLTTEQVLIDRDANVKISLGLSSNTEISSPSRKESPSRWGNTFFLQNPFFQNQSNEKIRQMQSNDIYNLGVIGIISAVGERSLFGLSEEDLEKNVNFEKHSICCFLHGEKQIFPGKKFYLIELLEKRKFSQEFIGILCQATRLNWQERGTFDSLYQKLKGCLNKASIQIYNSRLTIKEIIKLALFWENPKDSDEKTGHKFLEKLIENVKVVMPNCENWFTKEEYKPYLSHLQIFNEENEVFKNLEREIGVKKEVIFEKIKQVFKEFGFIGKETH